MTLSAEPLTEQELRIANYFIGGAAHGVRTASGKWLMISDERFALINFVEG